jgi:NAD(P)-dependent dehydrogenase (short-subunit alcohol dehydrogenase family)
MTDFASRRAIVTGGAHGIGASIVRRLRSAGAEAVVLDLDRSAAGAPTLLVDLANTGALRETVNRAIAQLGGCDVLVNCAGILVLSPLVDLEPEDYHHVLAVNLHAPVFMMKEVGRHMARAKYGRIVNITSVHGRLSEPRALAYDVSKAGLEAATRTASLELAPSGVLVNAVAPGFVRTRMSVVDGKDELESEWFQEQYVRSGRLPLGRAASTDEIAESVAWLASEANTYVTGQVLRNDGGLSARF